LERARAVLRLTRRSQLALCLQSKAHMTLFISLILSSFAWAQECPELSGHFRCDGGYEIEVSTFEKADGVHYRFEGPLEGSTELIADGRTRARNTKQGRANVRGYCRNGQLFADFAAVGPNLFRDKMYMERGALVRVRQSEGFINRRSGEVEFRKADAYVCRPIFPRR
jgi:hypothetical protein